jgi:putative colanic acid biosynthesis UDP-glucose lipid carrier transferase
MRPILVIIDIATINYLSLLFFNLLDKNLISYSAPNLNNKQLVFSVYITVLWLVSTTLINFYKIYRYTASIQIISLIIKQFLVFFIIVFAFIGFFRSVDISAFVTIKYLAFCFLIISFFKLLSYYMLKQFRLYFRGNLRNVVIVGNGVGAEELRKLFTLRKELGYKIIGKKIKNNIDEKLKFIKSHKEVDEIYCAIDEMTENQINQFVKYSSLNKTNIKFIPNRKDNFTKSLSTEYYNYTPVLSLREVALNNEVNQVIKRTFDIVFSLFVIVCVLSWLVPVLGILIKIESKGPVFFKHTRHGLNYKEFTCYKFRSLSNHLGNDADHVKENDDRVTKIGKFIRRTSIDELPQFINTFLGSMSIVGPRPHMISYTSEYSKKIDKYKFTYRHSVKPGITGLAQIKGFRGEVKSDIDIVNRIKFDIFYIENWSLLLDLNIIFQTIFNTFKGEEKAY